MSGGLKNIDNVVRQTSKDDKAPQNEMVTENVQPEQEGASGRPILSWEGESFDHVEKGTIWYLILALFVTALIGYLAWQKDWFTIGITVVVTGILVWYTTTQRPQTITYTITPIGIDVSGKFYPFSEIHSFWMIYNEKVQKLFIIFTKKYLPSMNIDIKNVDPNRLKNVLLRKIPEQSGKGENILDLLVRKLGL